MTSWVRGPTGPSEGAFRGLEAYLGGAEEARNPPGSGVPRARLEDYREPEGGVPPTAFAPIVSETV